ncbi:LVIVD repeat-containing protein [Lewinella sp. 4G2]|uniref:LVIVD repeat-containing protein n=1 Tax=Lewinella sp. 4G2 TaxID=1803372 RepID=UPI0007B4D28E|nr:hypothetical protein [Lewinella sp. 4G2]OAV45548.1 hypothetical protein A3850_014065 [Lewinella sp. 4G2]
MRYLILFLFSCITLTSCLEETCEDTIILQGFEPRIISTADFRSSSFGCFAPAPVCQATGFYVYQQYLFMVEDNKGLHIIDNSDTHNPVPITWMEVPGGQGLAVRNDILYINQYTDLIAFDLSDPTTPEFISRTEDVFEPNSVFTSVLSDGRFVANWAANGETRVVSCSSPNGGNEIFFEGDVAFATNINTFSNTAGANRAGGDVVGQGGSLARFTIAQSTLYAVDDNTLRAFSLADARNPSFEATIDLGWGIETIFPTEDKLFIGAANGMHIYGIDDPLNPEHLSTFDHVLGCDPVVVSGDLAYVTLWGGRDCGSIGDQLEIIDISAPRNPRSLQVTPMQSSHGLGVAEGKLFLCGQWEGMMVFDLTDDGLLGERLDRSTDIFARDVILLPENNKAIVLGYGQGGIQQYDYSDGGELTATSHIDVCK